MESRDYNHGKFFSPVQSYMGYVFIACGIFFAGYSPANLLFIIPGAFMAFTTTGTILDFDRKRLKAYTRHFGIIRSGNWVSVDQFTRFNLQKVTRRYTSYSRGNVKLDMDICDIKLMLLNSTGSKKIIINRYTGIEDARRDKDELSMILFSADQNKET